MNKLLLSVSGLALFLSSPALADVVDQQAAAPSVADRLAATALSDIVVTANRSAQNVDRVASSVTVLTRADLEAVQATAVAETLAQSAGVSFTRNGQMGSVASVSIRGAEGHHTVVLIDGVKMNDPSSTQGSANFGHLLVGDAARIEVLRGAQSTLWGSQAIGGVINIITSEPTKPLQGVFSAEAGSYGTTYFRGAIGGIHDRLSWRLAANRYDTDGYSTYAPGAEDDAYTNNSLSGRLNYRLTDNVSLDLRAVWSKGTSDFDGYMVDNREYSNTEELVTYAGVNFDLLGGRLRSRVGYGYTDTQRNSLNPERQTQIVTYEGQGENRRWDYQGVFAFTDDLSATFGVESERAEMRYRSPSDSATTPAYATGRADLNSAYVQLQWTALPGLNLTAGLRYDEHEQYGDNVLGQLAAAWSINDGKTIVRTSWGQGFRAPGLYELYSEYGNLSLKPEAFDAWEIGLEQKLTDKATIGVTYFNRQADNEIRYYGCAFGTTDPLCTVNGSTRWGYYNNIQKTEAQGIEAAGRYAITSALVISGNYTWTDAINASGVNQGRHLIRRPEHMANLAAEYGFRSGLKLGASARYGGKAFVNEANTAELEEYTLVDLRFSYPLTEALEVYGRVENIFDEDYATVQDFGTAGRSAFAGIRLRF